VDGANIEDLYDAAYFRSDLTAILAKHEFSAATMADGYSRMVRGWRGVRDIRGGCLNTVAGWGVAGQPRAGACADRPAPTSLDGGALSGHQRPQRRVERRGTVFRGVGVLPRVVNPADIVSALPEAIAAAKTGGPAVLLLPKNVQQSKIELNNSGQLLKRLIGDPYPVAQALRRAEGPVTIIAASRWPATMLAPSWSNCAQRCGRGWPPCPTPRTSPEHGASVIVGARVTGVMGHPAWRAAVADSALCLLVGTRMSVTARTGLDDALASVSVYSIGSTARMCRVPMCTPTTCAARCRC